MPDLNTKQKIIHAAIKLFNADGMANVTQQQMASSIGISPGNLAYHYKNKETIIRAVDDYVHEAIEEVLRAYRIYPNLIDLDNQLTAYYEFIDRYTFYFLDSIEIARNYPDLGKRRDKVSHKIQIQIRKRFDFNLSRDILLGPQRAGTYDDVSVAIWTLLSSWAPQRVWAPDDELLGAPAFKKMIWNQIYPYLTQKGIAEYEQLIMPMLKEST